MYPLQDEYVAKIEDFLDGLNQENVDVQIRSNNMSTRLFGNFDAVTNLLNSAMYRSMQKHGKIVFVCKYLQGDARELEGYD